MYTSGQRGSLVGLALLAEKILARVLDILDRPSILVVSDGETDGRDGGDGTMRTIERDDWTPEVTWMASGARTAGVVDDTIIVTIAGSYQFEETPGGRLVAREFGCRRDRRLYTRMTLAD